MTETSLVLTLLLFGIYGWLCSVECGIGLLRLLPSSTLSQQGLRLLRPLWIVTNLFLVLGCVAFVTLFNEGFRSVARQVRPLVILAIAAILLRLLLLLYLKFAMVRQGPRWQNLLLNAVTLVVPLSFGAAGIVLLTGQDFWQTPVGWTMLLTLGLGLIAIALSFVYFVVGQTPHDRLHQVSRWLNILLAIVGVSVFQLSIARHAGHLVATPYLYLVWFVALVALLQIILWLSARERYMWWYLSLIGIATPLLFGLANRPYLVYPQLSIRTAASGSNNLLAVSILLPCTLIATAIFVASLFIQPQAGSPKPKRRR